MNDATHYLKTLDAKVMPSKVQSFAQNSKHLIHKLHQNPENEKVFSSYAAHELRSPLTAIKTHIQLAQLMAEQQASSPKLQQSLQQADHSIRRYTQLLEQLLALSSTDQALSDVRYSTEIAPLLTQVIADLRPFYPEIEPSLTIDWPSLSRIALLDFALYTVFKNLLENALLHAQAKSISIAMLHEVLIIHDDGQSLKIEDIVKPLNYPYTR